MDLKTKRLLRKVAKLKLEIDNLQDDLTLIYDKLKDLGVTEEELQDVIKIKLMTNQVSSSWDTKGLVEEYGEDVKKHLKTTPKKDFYRVTKLKDFYKNN